MDKNGRKWTETDKNGQKRTETDRNGQKTARHGQKGTGVPILRCNSELYTNLNCHYLLFFYLSCGLCTIICLCETFDVLFMKKTNCKSSIHGSTLNLNFILLM